MKYSIVIPTYNHCDDLLKPCIESILAYSCMTNVELVISANGCVDNTREYLKKLKSDFDNLGFVDHVKIVWNDQPLGFSRAVNEGIRASTGDRLLLLNNDVVLLPQPRNSWLDRLNDPFETNPRAGITTTLKLFSPQTGRHFAVFFCTMIDRKVIRQLGLLDESFGIGAGEDTEYCFRAEQEGFEVIGVAQTHYEPSIGTNASDFPLWHKAEGTMHDPQLVPNWHEHFNANTELLEQRFTPTCVAQSPAELAAKFPELCVQDSEIPGLFRDVLQNNAYGLTLAHLRNREVIDIGANVGFFSLAAAAMGASKVLSYEPITQTFQMLKHNTELTKLSHKIKCHAQAVLGRACDPVVMGVNHRHGSNSLYSTGEASQLVTVTTLAEIMKQTYSHDVILKMDCEGAEFDIILDTEPDVFSRIRYIHLEIHSNMHPIHKHRDLIAQRLTELGFSCVSSQNVGMYWYDSQGQVTSWEPGQFYTDFWSK